MTGGGADCLAGDAGPRFRELFTTWYRFRDGTLPKFEEIADYVTCDPPLKHLAYSQGFHMIRFMTTKGGDDV